MVRSISDHLAQFLSLTSYNLKTIITRTYINVTVNIINTSNKYFSDFLTDTLQSKFFVTPALPDEVQEIVNSLNHKRPKEPNTKVFD